MFQTNVKLFLHSAWSRTWSILFCSIPVQTFVLVCRASAKPTSPIFFPFPFLFGANFSGADLFLVWRRETPIQPQLLSGETRAAKRPLVTTQTRTVASEPPLKPCCCSVFPWGYFCLISCPCYLKVKKGRGLRIWQEGLNQFYCEWIKSHMKVFDSQVWTLLWGLRSELVSTLEPKSTLFMRYRWLCSSSSCLHQHDSSVEDKCLCCRATRAWWMEGTTFVPPRGRACRWCCSWWVQHIQTHKTLPSWIKKVRSWSIQFNDDHQKGFVSSFCFKLNLT